ncbi:uncharacterized protein [Ambystoma mexicanum]|uniref:uncharacterized protein n=1 Tax=Ambystoma mexicanum TaxID=8296 RepID=UPI0037E94128
MTLDKVLGIFERNGIVLKEEKCQFGVTKVDYLGHEISGEGVEPKDSLVGAIKEVKHPANKVQLKSFLGMTEFYQKFVRNYASKVIELRKLLKKGCEFVWSPMCEGEFVRLKNEINLARL